MKMLYYSFSLYRVYRCTMNTGEFYNSKRKFSATVKKGASLINFLQKFTCVVLLYLTRGRGLSVYNDLELKKKLNIRSKVLLTCTHKNPSK